MRSIKHQQLVVWLLFVLAMVGVASAASMAPGPTQSIGEACDKPSKPFARVCADSRECQGEKTLDGLEWLYHPYLMLAVDSVDNLWPWDQMTVYWDAVTLDLGCGMCVPEPHHNSCWSPFVNATE